MKRAVLVLAASAEAVSYADAADNIAVVAPEHCKLLKGFSFAILHWFQLIPPFVKQSPVHAEFLGQRDDGVATLQPLRCHLAKGFGAPPDCSLLCHSQLLSLQGVANQRVSFLGVSPSRNRRTRFS